MFKKFIPRGIAFVAVIALALVSATSVFAEGLMQGDHAIRSDSSSQGLESQWKAEIAAIKTAQFLNNRLDRLAGSWLDQKRTFWEVHRLIRLTRRANSLLQQAEITETNHPGFDAKGQVTDNALAAQSIQSLMNDLHRLQLLFKNRLFVEVT